MRTSPQGVALICRFEGFRAKAYQDEAGVWTIGYGHTSMAGRPVVTAGLEVTEPQAKEIMANDLVKFEQAVSRVIKVRATQNQFDAMVSLCYNIGPRNFGGSSLVRFFNAGDLAAAERAFLPWNKIRKHGVLVFNQGLANRRSQEAAFFAAKQPHSTPPAPTGQQPPPKPSTPPPAPRKSIWRAILDLFKPNPKGLPMLQGSKTYSIISGLLVLIGTMVQNGTIPLSGGIAAGLSALALAAMKQGLSFTMVKMFEGFAEKMAASFAASHDGLAKVIAEQVDAGIKKAMADQQANQPPTGQ